MKKLLRKVEPVTLRSLEEGKLVIRKLGHVSDLPAEWVRKTVVAHDVNNKLDYTRVVQPNFSIELPKNVVGDKVEIELSEHMSTTDSLENVCWIVDWDISRRNTSRSAFYRSLKRLMKKHGSMTRSSQSVLIIDDEAIAKEVYALASRYAENVNLYKAEKIF